jgi:hypothetical protein
METKTATWMIGVVAIAALAGCTETTSSENIKTGGIAALIEVTAGSESSSTVKATLKVGGDESNTYVILDKGDELAATANGDTKGMSAQSEGVYEAEFGTGAADTEFQVDLKRPNDTPAPDSRGTLPAPFKIGTLEDGKSRKADPLDVTWDPSGSDDSMELEINGSCIFLYSKDIPGDSGSYTIEAGQLDSTGGDKPETCDLNVTLSRKRSGSTDPAYDNESYFHLAQVRKAKVTSAP